MAVPFAVALSPVVELADGQGRKRCPLAS
jgi:hypothetical protein